MTVASSKRTVHERVTRDPRELLAWSARHRHATAIDVASTSDTRHGVAAADGDRGLRDTGRVLGIRLRQAVVVAADLDRALAELRSALPLGAPFHDPEVAAFGLRNAVCALGDAFVEVVSPLRDGTAAGRHLARRGDGGYMLLVQVPDVAAARARAASAGIRAVWSVDLPDIAATHLHPGDVGGTILSVDQPVPPESWRWAGPGWEPGSGALRGATVEVPDPVAVAARWAAVLGLRASSEPALRLDGGTIRFMRGDGGLTALAAEAPGAGPARTVTAAGVRLDVQTSAPAGTAGALGTRSGDPARDQRPPL